LSTYSVQVKWPGDPSFTDLTPATDRNYSFDLYSCAKDFKFVKNTFQVEVVYSSALALKLLSLLPSDLVPFTVDKDAVRIFTGYLIPVDSVGYASWRRTTIPLTVQDPSLALDCALASDLVYLDHWLSKPSDTAHSLLHKLFPMASATVAYTPPNTATTSTMGGVFNPETNNYLPLFLATAGDNLLEALTNLLWQQGWRWWFDADGTAQFAPWINTVGASVTFSVANENVIDGSFRIDRTGFVEDSVEVEYSTAGTLVHIGKTGEGWSCFKASDPAQTIPLKIDGTAQKSLEVAYSSTTQITIVAPAEAGGKSLLTWGIAKIRFFVQDRWHYDNWAHVQAGVDGSGYVIPTYQHIVGDLYLGRRWLELDTGTGVVTEVSRIDATYGTLGFSVTGYSYSSGVINFNLVASGAPTLGTALQIGIQIPDLTGTVHGDNLTAKSTGARGTKAKKYRVGLPTNEAMAENLADFLRQNLIGLPQVYALKSYGDYALGAGCTVDIGGITATGFIHGKSYDESSRSFGYKIKQLSAATTGTTTITSPTDDDSNLVPDLVPEPPVEEYYILTSSASVAMAASGAMSPATLYATGYRRLGGGDGVPILGRFKIYETADGTTWTTVYTSASDEASKDYAPSVAATKGIKFEFFAAGGTVTLLAVYNVSVAVASDYVAEFVVDAVATQTAKYRGCFTVDPAVDNHLGDLYLYTTSLTTGAGDSVLRIYTLSGWADVTSPTSDQIALAQGDIFRRATFLEGGVIVPVRSTDFVLRLFSEFISAYSVQFQDTVGSTAGGGGTPTAGDMLIYMGKDPRLTGTRPYEFAIKEFIGSNGVQEEWMAHLLTKFLTSGVLALVLSGCLQATQVTSSPGKVWNEVTHPFGASQILIVAHGNGVWVAVGVSGKIARSTDDGVTWGSLITNPFGTDSITTVEYSNGVWVAVGVSGKIARSTDGGVTWGSLITNPFGTSTINTLSSGNGTWIAGADGGKIARSTDGGVTWGSLITNPFGATIIRSISHGTGSWIAGGDTGKVARSTDDGVTWLAVSTEISSHGTALSWGGLDFSDLGSFVMIGYDGISASYILRSIPLEAGGGVVGKGIEARGRYIDMSDGTRIWNTVNDSRITTGTVNRTETVVALEVGQMALIEWACGITGGTARAITFALPAVGTYQVDIDLALVPTNVLAASVHSAIAGGKVYSGGTVAGGSSVVVNGLVTSGFSEIFSGTVKRIT